MATSRNALRNAESSLWLYNPWLDLIVGCGAWSAPLLLLAYFSVASNELRWSLAFYVLALFFNYPHYMATIYRAYHRESDFSRYRIFTVHITFLVFLTLILTHVWPRALPWIFTIYLTGSPWHYSGQNYGLCMMFARRAGAQPDRRERNAIYGAFLLSYAILFVNFHTGPSSDPLFVSLNLSARVSLVLQIAFAIAFVACSTFGLSRLLGQARLRDLAPSLTLFTTQFAWFLLPTILALGEKLQIPQSRYSTGVLAVMHSAQYLWITSYYARREAQTESRSSWRLGAYFLVLVAGGIALFVPGPWIASRVFHFDFTRSFLIFTALVNLHHFILDGAIWKLREGRIAAFLIQSKPAIADATEPARNRLAQGFRWLVGTAPAAHYLRVGAALALLAWGTLDQIRHYFALQDDRQDLQRAAKLAAYDSSVQLRLAHKDIESGEKDAAVAAWKQAMAADPSNPTPRNLYLQYLTQEKRYDEAYAVTQAALQHDPRDAQLLMNDGTLALELGKPGEALQSWQQAVAADPHLADAHLYLAAELDAQGKTEQALVHYKKFLALTASQQPENRPSPATVVSAALKMGDCQLRLHQPEDASRSYEMARKLAAQTKEARLESIASMNQASLYAQAGKPQDALQLYQRAIFLDDSLHDAASESADLYQFAGFLHAAGYPPAMPYAAILRGDALATGAGTAKPPTVESLRNNLEKQLGSEAAAIRRAPDSALAHALSARP